MIEFRRRKVTKISNSVWMSLPKEWTLYSNVKQGDFLNVSLAPDKHSLFVRKEAGSDE